MFKKISDPFDPKFIKQFNELQKAVESLYVSVSHPLEIVYRASGQHLRLVPQEMDGVVVETYDGSDDDSDADEGAYIVEEVFPLVGGDWHSESEPRRVVAYGYNRSSVPIGSYVRCYYTSAGDWRFVEGVGSGSGSGYDSSDSPLIPTNCVRVLADLVCEDGVTVKQFVYIPVLANVQCQAPSDEPVS